MKQSMSILVIAALAMHVSAAPARAELSDGEKAAAALAILGIAALAAKKNGYNPTNNVEAREYERGYRDGLNNLPYWEYSQTRGYVHGYTAGSKERETAGQQRPAAGQKAPPMAIKGCTRLVAQNFAVPPGKVQIVRSRSTGKHQWQIETVVGREHMVCSMRDTGEVIDLRGGRM